MDRASISLLVGTVCEVIRTADVPVKAVSDEDGEQCLISSSLCV